ncbi:hypothetical protein NDU88_006410 [Pleurodeles waltl]|uniref:Uncharacterized protein n=1 Tax=Pleurodeles waltl TaxID=8319 RepID=A0AAV7TYB5_PLEWA|nr:hypothetical protein NDU88_006410 [Pleurodeles waltl]
MPGRSLVKREIKSSVYVRETQRGILTLGALCMIGKSKGGPHIRSRERTGRAFPAQQKSLGHDNETVDGSIVEDSNFDQDFINGYFYICENSEVTLQLG